jgi:hypothetical protein
MRAAPMVETTRANQPVESMRSRAKRVAATASRTGMVPTISEACETVVRARPENWMRNWSGIPRKEQNRRVPHSRRSKLGRWVKRSGSSTRVAKRKR